MSYRDDLSAALLRNDALERELAMSRVRIHELENPSEEIDEFSAIFSAVEEKHVPSPPKKVRRIQLARHGALAEILSEGEKEQARERMREERAAERARRQKLRAKAFQARYERYERRRRRVRSCSPMPRAAHWVAPLIAPASMLPFMALFILFEPARQVGLALLLLISMAYVLANLGGYWGWHREQRRLSALPFPVSGHLQAVGDELSDPTLIVSFDEGAPSRRELEIFLTGLATKKLNPFDKLALRHTKVEISGKNATFTHPNFKTQWMKGNYGYRRWYHDLVTKGLVKLHTHAPIRSITVKKKS